jgi:hypothetical protein
MKMITTLNQFSSLCIKTCEEELPTIQVEDVKTDEWRGDTTPVLSIV